MPYLILTSLLFLLVYLPSIWVRYIMHKYAKPIDLPGTGGELASHLIQRFSLEPVIVEETTHRNDHYDPAAKVVRLSPANFNDKSLTAIAVAAHEIGHAIQFNREEDISRLRKKYLPVAMMMKRSGIFLLALLPIVGIVLKAPAAVFALVAISLGLQLVGALAFLIVLPEEWDASFNKALPILIEGDYIEERDIPAVQEILKAAAFTYFARAMADVVNIGRWLIILRR